jgi:hypothetical protein
MSYLKIQSHEKCAFISRNYKSKSVHVLKIQTYCGSLQYAWTVFTYIDRTILAVHFNSTDLRTRIIFIYKIFWCRWADQASSHRLWLLRENKDDRGQHHSGTHARHPYARENPPFENCKKSANFNFYKKVAWKEDVRLDQLGPHTSPDILNVKKSVISKRQQFHHF